MFSFVCDANFLKDHTIGSNIFILKYEKESIFDPLFLLVVYLPSQILKQKKSFNPKDKLFIRCNMLLINIDNDISPVRCNQNCMSLNVTNCIIMPFYQKYFPITFHMQLNMIIPKCSCTFN